MFLCPCCGEPYLIPLAFCEFILEERIRGGWNGTIAPAKCVDRQEPIAKGDPVMIRQGTGVSEDGERHELPAGSKARVLEVATWEGEGSIFLVRLPTGKAVYVARAQLAPEPEGAA
jgi:hypothetical protein